MGLYLQELLPYKQGNFHDSHMISTWFQHNLNLNLRYNSTFGYGGEIDDVVIIIISLSTDDDCNDAWYAWSSWTRPLQSWEGGSRMSTKIAKRA